MFLLRGHWLIYSKTCSFANLSDALSDYFCYKLTVNRFLLRLERN